MGKKKDVTKGAGPIVAEAPTVTIGGQQYPMRRLNVRDVFTLGRILAAAVGALGGQLNELAGDLTAGQVAQLLAVGFPYAEGPAMQLLGGLVGMTADEFSELPPDAVPVVINGLVETQDLTAFLDSCRGLIQNPSTKDFLNRLSTSSSTATAGKMTSS